MTKIDRSNLTADQKIDAILDRLDEGHDRFARVEANQSIAFNWMRELALTRGRRDLVEQMDAHAAAEMNGVQAADRDEPTDPGIA